ncbi:hypothetical protein BT63DRAFT_439088 [Microthyrium microscopicum]|uniref:Uncharacterized protein n=1 Tax=Microthyrium microscopicum TaxID=703497 RepID=A0A6A6UCC4_9PEZI|nr:hypothetical protein BT63DRAFT_439088 [Microthyrium microscopicum]
MGCGPSRSSPKPDPWEMNGAATSPVVPARPIKSSFQTFIVNDPGSEPYVQQTKNPAQPSPSHKAKKQPSGSGRANGGSGGFFGAEFVGDSGGSSWGGHHGHGWGGGDGGGDGGGGC